MRVFQGWTSSRWKKHSHLPPFWNGLLEVIEIPGGDATKARIFLGPQLAGPTADLVPVTLQFVDGHHDSHHPDMLVLFQDTQMTFRNQNGTFTPFSLRLVRDAYSSSGLRREAN